MRPPSDCFGTELLTVRIDLDGYGTSQPGGPGRAVIGAGQSLSSAWESESSVSIRQFLSDVVARVVVLETGIQVLVRMGALIRELLRYPGSPRNVKVRKILAADKAEDLITLDIDSRLKRCDGEVRLVLPADSVEETKRRPLPSLIKAIARAHDWYEQIVAGRITGRRSIGKATGLDERYVAQILHAGIPGSRHRRCDLGWSAACRPHNGEA